MPYFICVSLGFYGNSQNDDASSAVIVVGLHELKCCFVLKVTDLILLVFAHMDNHLQACIEHVH